MKVLLLNDGGYGCGLENVNYPVEVTAQVDKDVPSCVTVLGSELIRVGGSPDDFYPKYKYFFEKSEFKPA